MYGQSEFCPLVQKELFISLTFVGSQSKPSKLSSLRPQTSSNTLPDNPKHFKILRLQIISLFIIPNHHLQNSILPQNIEYLMQKLPQLSATKTLLPCIYGQQKRNLRSISHQHRKENIHTENSCSEKYQHQGSNARFSKKFSAANVNLKIEEIKDLVAEERQGQGTHTRRKLSRPWVEREIDFNKETIKNQQLNCLLKQQTSQGVKLRPSKKTILQEATDLTMNNLAKTKEIILNKTRNFRAISDRIDIAPKQKISTCKIAMKKGVFPLNKQHYEQLKVSQYFQRQDAISIISHRECSELGEQFISRESLLNIVF